MSAIYIWSRLWGYLIMIYGTLERFSLPSWWARYVNSSCMHLLILLVMHFSTFCMISIININILMNDDSHTVTIQFVNLINCCQWICIQLSRCLIYRIYADRIKLHNYARMTVSNKVLQRMLELIQVTVLENWEI